jgi:hypothetical protein
MNVARLLPAIIVLIPVAALAQSSSPAATVTAFYNYDRTHSQVLTRGNINARIRWLTADFVRELREEEVREAAESKLHPDEKPWFGDGFRFQPDEEFVKEHGVRCRLRMSIAGQKIKTLTARVTARFAYTAPCEAHAELWKLHHVKVQGRWLINDIIYPDGGSYRKQIRPN